ncbi:MAG: sulfatase-like hydrolase/transferase [Sedimentisphaerales bacterium]|nr:sulfatase-like hydrolase/transferase [Sedimentisphaerales bacterium]
MEPGLRTRRDFLKAAGLCASAFVVSGCASGVRKSAGKPLDDRPNILWITCEDVSPQYLGCYGDDYATTPNLDKFATQAVRCTKAFATAPVCAPSRSCLVTGVYATSTGTQHLRSDVKLPGKIKCFPRLLREAGYYCSNNYKKDYNFKDVGVWDESSHDAHWRNRKPGQPFFSVFNFVSTHQGQINGSDELFFETYRSKLKGEELHDGDKITLPPYYPDTPLVRKIWARYYDLITFMDKQVAGVLAELEADGLAEETIVFFFSDHGMGLPRFKRTLYDSGLHVPLMVRFPKKYEHLSSLKGGVATERLVSFVDFAPTVLNLLDLPIPDYMQGTPFLGPQSSAARRHVFGAASRVDEVYELQRCVRGRRYKYIRNFMPHLPYIQPSEYPDRAEIMQELRRAAAEDKLTAPQRFWWLPRKPVEEFYDTQADPHEINNLADSAEHKNIIDKMRRILRGWIIETRDTGFMFEAEMHIRSKGSTPYEMATKPRKYPIRHILSAAELVGASDDKLPEMTGRLESNDSAARHWAVVALAALGDKGEAAADALTASLADRSPNVRFAAAGVLCKLGLCEDALGVLAKGLEDRRETVVLHAAREIQGIGSKACAIVPQIELARARCKNPDESYKNDNYAMFIDWALQSALANCKQ